MCVPRASERRADADSLTLISALRPGRSVNVARPNRPRRRPADRVMWPLHFPLVAAGQLSDTSARPPRTRAVRDVNRTPEKDSVVPPEGFDLHPPVVLMKGSHYPAFFISWRSQRDVVNSLGWKSSLMIWGGPALTLVCIYFLFEYLGRL